jgi:hypothetical protein
MPEIVVKAEREAKSGICVLTVDLGTGRFEERSYRGIYGGLSWAGMGHPFLEHARDLWDMIRGK